MSLCPLWRGTSMNASRYLRSLGRLGWVGWSLLWAMCALACPVWAGWEAGDFQTLPTISVTDLVLFVADARHMPHHTHGYTVPKRARADSFNALLDTVFSAIDTMLAEYPHRVQHWCDVVQHQAPRAHYAILRLWEKMSHRYFIYLKDTS